MTMREADSELACPTCGRDDFASTGAMRGHHAQIHNEKIRCELECEWCGSDFQVAPSRKDSARFCSESCSAEWRSDSINGEDHPRWKENVSLTCNHCGGQYDQYPYLAEEYNSDFCPDCWGKDVSKQCERCDSTFTVAKCRAESARFCSQSCTGAWLSETIRGEKHPRWVGGTSPYGQGWNERKREKVRDRDGRKCQSCGLSEEDHATRLHVHHITPAREFDDPSPRNNLENLVSLCGSCHQVWERMTPLSPDTATSTN
jgi:5-methylcytosine-specific restriction endonuclease McrA